VPGRFSAELRAAPDDAKYPAARKTTVAAMTITTGFFKILFIISLNSDPFRKLNRQDANRPVPGANPLRHIRAN
jgi:hypothetical protein